MTSKKQFPESFGLIALGCRSASFLVITSVCAIHESIILLF